jgi:hypothetical protein
MVLCRIVCAVLEKLKADAKDDLYFAGGRDRLTFRNLVASGHLPQAMLARCVDLSPSALGGPGPAMEMWEEILAGATSSTCCSDSFLYSEWQL